MKMFNRFLKTKPIKVIAVEVDNESLIITTAPFPDPSYPPSRSTFKLERKKGTEMAEAIALAEELDEYTDNGIAVLNSYLQDHGLHLERIEE